MKLKLVTPCKIKTEGPTGEYFMKTKKQIFVLTKSVILSLFPLLQAHKC